MTWTVEDALGALKATYQSEQKYFTNLTACIVVPVHAYQLPALPKATGPEQKWEMGGGSHDSDPAQH